MNFSQQQFCGEHQSKITNCHRNILTQLEHAESKTDHEKRRKGDDTKHFKLNIRAIHEESYNYLVTTVQARCLCI